MGKGDKKTKKGKISAGSYGVSRKRKKKAVYVAKPKAKKATKKEEVLDVSEESVVKETTKKAPAKKKPVAKKAPAKKAPAKKKPTAKK